MQSTEQSNDPSSDPSNDSSARAAARWRSLTHAATAAAELGDHKPAKTRQFIRQSAPVELLQDLVGAWRPSERRTKPGDIPFVYETALKLLCWSFLAYEYEPA